MGSIAEIVSELKFGRSTLLDAIDGLSERELTQTPIYENWTIKDVLAHVIGWDRRVLATLPLILQDRAGEIPGVEVEEHNQQSVAAWKDKSLAEVLAAIQSTHQQILDIITSIDHVEIDRRHERRGRVLTIRSYVIDIMMEHERRHAIEIEQWRKKLEAAIEPAAIKAELLKRRAQFMIVLDKFTEGDVLAKGAVNGWSISDLVGHIADWEQVILMVARHIHDPSQPAVEPVAQTIAGWNEIMAANRADKSWPENHHYLRETQRVVDKFVTKLKPGDWKLRGSYPWLGDRGTLAELITYISEHYHDHLPDIKNWYEKRHHEPHP